MKETASRSHAHGAMIASLAEARSTHNVMNIGGPRRALKYSGAVAYMHVFHPTIEQWRWKSYPPKLPLKDEVASFSHGFSTGSLVIFSHPEHEDTHPEHEDTHLEHEDAHSRNVKTRTRNTKTRTRDMKTRTRNLKTHWEHRLTAQKTQAMLQPSSFLPDASSQLTKKHCLGSRAGVMSFGLYDLL